MEKSPKISVLMPIYKTAPYLKEAVDSILSQTYADFELIALNDCSPDNAEEILDGYDDERIVRYRGSENVGLANILNIGIGMSRGEYIARMDSDDISLPNRFEFQINYLEQHPEIDLLSCGMTQFGIDDKSFVFDGDLEFLKFSALFHTPVLHASSIWRKERFESNNLRYRQASFPTEDYDLWTRAILKGLHLKNIPRVGYLYRTHSTQVTNILNDNNIRSAQNIRKKYICSIFPDIKENDLSILLSLNELFATNPYKFKEALDIISFENDRVGFFNKKRLMNLSDEKFKRCLYAYCLNHKYTARDLLNLGFVFTYRLFKNRK